MNKEIMVSINCIAYNHKNYIADAIEGFLLQKTDFSYEILIHDDASTDGTADIIRAYEKKYPDLIKPIYQAENQHSKGVKNLSVNSARAKGKYIAICEGDDYWIDPYKLQKQVDYMETHPECTLCVHASFKVLPDKKKFKSNIRANQGNKIYTVEQVIAGDGGMFATNSMLYPVRLDKRPYFFQNAPVGDYPLAIFLAMHGTVFYMDEFMSAYRVAVRGSWSERISSNAEARILFNNKLIVMLNQMDEYSNFKYKNAFNTRILRSKLDLLVDQGKYKQIKEGELKEIYRSLNYKIKIYMFLQSHFPVAIKLIRYIKWNVFRL